MINIKTHYDQLYIAGQWQNSHSEQKLWVVNPATEETCASVPNANNADVEAAIAAARAAFDSWSQSSVATRAQLLHNIADEMQLRYKDLIAAHVISMGCPEHLTGAFHVDAAIEAMRYYADLAHKMEEAKYVANISLHKEAIGVCAFINPWNYPLHQLTGKIAPALAAGCTIVTKPAEQTPIQDFIMAEIFDKVGLPAGVFNLVTGVGKHIGPLLSSHPQVDMVSFTGSTAAGINVASAAAPTVKRVCQELGGKSAMIITQDADLPAAVRYAVEDVMANTGQTCNALTRLLIPQSCYDEVLALAKQFANEQVVGDPLDSDTTMGPMASRRQLDTVLSYIDLGIQEGAKLITGGRQPDNIATGTYILPTIFADVTNDMRIAREEIFGPVLCIITYRDIEEAIAIANDSVYGLSSAVYAKDKTSALPIAKRMRAGQCYIQGGYFSMHAPFGGYKQSGNGREWGEHGLDEYLETKAIISG
jgi:aldehyde dehydrogenase (NAD+)